MTTVVIIGAGNLATHLFRAFNNSEEIRVVQVFNRSLSKIKDLDQKVPLTDNISDLVDADVYVISIADDAIEPVSGELSISNRLVVHTSGSVALNKLDPKNRRGVFYPLQSFTKVKDVEFKEIPICIEAENEPDLNILNNLGDAISEKVYRINSEQRKSLHLSAVFVNNFVNHLYYIGQDLCEAHQVPFEILTPLIEETAAKIKKLSPKEAQTGPARRNDIKTINSHLEQLENKTYKEIYELLTRSLKETYGRKKL